MKAGNTLKAFQILHKAMLFGLLVFAAVVTFLVYSGKFAPALSNLDKTLQLIGIAISFAAFFIGSSISKKKLLQAKNTPVIHDKAGIFRSACIIQWALLEGACLFCIICFMLVGNYAYLGLAAALIIWLALNGPSKMKVMLQLGLSEQEMENF